MKLPHILGLAFILIGLLSILWMNNGESSEQLEAYNKTTQDKRNRIKHFMRSNEQSPIPTAERENFNGPQFYPIDKTWRVKAKLKPKVEKDTINLGEAGKVPKYYTLLGNLNFKLKNKDCQLPLYQSLMPPKTYFLGFLDDTNGNTTYGGGRYLDPLKEGDQWILDFNLAYHPYCFYNEAFYCPVIPAANRLDLKVEAGENGTIQH